MAGTIRLYGGSKKGMPALPDRAPGWCSDTQELFIGSGEGNLLLASCGAAAGEYDRLTLKPGAWLEEGQLGRNAAGEPIFMSDGTAHRLAFRGTAPQPLDASADLAAMIAGYNALLEALKKGKVMD